MSRIITTKSIQVTAKRILELVGDSENVKIPDNVKYDFLESSNRHSNLDALVLEIEWTE